MIYYYSVFIIWALVPFRQLGKKYFFYFYALICQDVITEAARLFFHSRTNIFETIFSLLCLISLQDKNESKVIRIWLLILCITSIVLELFGLTFRQEFSMLCFLNFLMFLKFLQTFIYKLVNERVINIFLICLMFYELTLITKLFGLITGFANAVGYFYITTTFEVIFGIFFCFFKEDSPKLIIGFDSPYEKA